MWLSDVKCKDHHEFIQQRRHKSTGDWLLQNAKFLEWRNARVSSMLWLRGDREQRSRSHHHTLTKFKILAGSGKTVLA